MIEPAIARIVDLAQAAALDSRKTFVRMEDGSQRWFMWDDGAKKYVPVEAYVQRGGTNVATLRSFIDLVLAEAPRFGDETGKKGTVTFHPSGAAYRPDYLDGRITPFEYKRTLAVPWTQLGALVKSCVDQPSFVRALQALRPWLLDGPAVLRAYRAIDFTKKVNFKGQPFIENGKAGTTLGVEVTLASGKNEKASFPTELKFVVPYTNDSDPVEITLETDVILDEEAGKVFFSAAWPEQAADASAAQEAEYAQFIDTVKAKLPDIVILRNF